MLRCEQYHPSTGAVAPVTTDQISQLLTQPDTLLWVDLVTPTEQELSWLSEQFHFHPLAMEDVRNRRQRAKLDRYDGFSFFVLHAFHYHRAGHQVDSDQIAIFIGPNYLVTVQHQPVLAIDDVRRRWEQAHLPHEALPFLFYLITDAIVDAYFPVIDEIGEVIDDIDTLLFTRPSTSILHEIFDLRKGLLTIRKLLGPLRDALNELIRVEEDGNLSATGQTRAYFTDLYDHVLRLTDFVDTYRDMLAGSLEAYQSSIANTLNTNMQRLTVAATVLATSTVVTGFYGMNVRGLMINSAWPYGGHLVLGILLVTTIIEIWLFRRARWI